MNALSRETPAYVAVGAFLSDRAVVLRTRPVVRVEASLLLPDRVNRSVAHCQEHGLPAVCVNLSVCFTVHSRRYNGQIALQYNLTADTRHKDLFPARFYFHGNGSANSMTGRVKVRWDQTTCNQHLAYMRRDVRDIFSPLHFEVSYGLKDLTTPRGNTSTFPPLRPILQQSAGQRNHISNKTEFSRHCSLANCSTNLQLSAFLLLPQLHAGRAYFALGTGRTIMLNSTIINAGDDAFLPRLSLRFPSNLQYIKVLDTESPVNCELSDQNQTIVSVDCSVTSLYLLAKAKLNISFLLNVNQSSRAGDITISLNTTGHNHENKDYLHDNHASLVLPLRYGVDVNIHGFVTPSSFLFGEEESTPVDCYTEKFNYTYKVVNIGPSCSLDTLVEIDLPKTLSPHPYSLLHIVDHQISQGVCSVRSSSVPLLEDCNVPAASSISELAFFFSKITRRKMFCSHDDILCETLVCRLGDLEQGKEVTIQLEVRLNPTVLQQAPGRHGIILLESTGLMTSPREDSDTILIQPRPFAQVVLEAHFNQKMSRTVEVFLIVISLLLGLLILAGLIYCLWKAGFFKREFQKKEEDLCRDSWDYVPKSESTS
ncbi:integrin alpha-4 [Aplochiton taeniatus]